MIELNCSYEESKKILELGYDFSRVCTRFECRDDDDIKVVYGEKVTEDTIRNQYTLIDNEPWFQGQAWCQGFIPIILKAALEKCLPELSGSTWLKNLRTNWVILDLDPHIIKLESIFEAFIWCHENYPEELRKKFEEVMK